MINYVKTVQEFDNLIQKDNVLVDFYTSWCGPCKMLSPIIEEIAEENKNLTVIKVDVEEVRELGLRYQIQAVPSLFHFRKGTLVDKVMGYQSKDSLIEFVTK